MTISVRHSIGDLQRDMTGIARRAPGDMRGVVRSGIRLGNNIAKGNARRTAGAHGVHYPDAFSAEMHGLNSAIGGGLTYSGEYGPDVNHAGGQGGMSFEDGSRNQPAHKDIARSFDLIRGAFVGETRQLPGKWFW